MRSIGPSEILAAEEAIEEGNVLALTMSLVLGFSNPLHIMLDLKDLYTCLLTKRNSVEKSIGADANCIRFHFERRNVARIVSIPENLHFADPSTSFDSPLTASRHLTLRDGRLSHSFGAAEVCGADRPLG